MDYAMVEFLNSDVSYETGVRSCLLPLRGIKRVTRCGECDSVLKSRSNLHTVLVVVVLAADALQPLQLGGRCWLGRGRLQLLLSPLSRPQLSWELFTPAFGHQILCPVAQLWPLPPFAWLGLGKATSNLCFLRFYPAWIS